MNEPNWQAVDSLPAGGLLQQVETAVVDVGVVVQRFTSDRGGRALLVPLRPLVEGEVPGIRVSDAPAEATGVLFVDPARGAGLLGLLTALGPRAKTVQVALPGEADTPGLIAEAGGVIVGATAGSPTSYRLFRVEDQRTLSPRRTAGVAELGEDADVLEQRSKWFRAREGGPE